MPKYAVISSGKDNRYSHPNQEVLELLNRFNVEVLRTDNLGMIKIKSNGEQISIAY
jgi:competence protein ComEC